MGAALARGLRERGDSVRVFGRGSYAELEAVGIDCAKGDITDYEALKAACDDRDVVFHVAAKVGLWGAYGDFYSVNVEGTKNVLRACQEQGIRKLVFTGSPSVVFHGGDVDGVDESAPYPEKFDSFYSQTKAESERMVLAANYEKLSTVSLRPHFIWGPGDRNLLPRMISRQKAGRLYRIGDDNKLVDTIYVDDAVTAHILAAVQLSPLSDIAGKAYFLSGDDPRPFWQIVDLMLAAAGLGPVKKRLPKAVAFGLASICEGTWKALRLSSEPPLTKFLVNTLTTAHWFDISAAKRDLGWKPKMKIEDGMARVEHWIKATQRDI
jgi:nucleoside-diphosphate-sugar epimerase